MKYFGMGIVFVFLVGCGPEIRMPNQVTKYQVTLEGCTGELVFNGNASSGTVELECDALEVSGSYQRVFE